MIVAILLSFHALVSSSAPLNDESFELRPNHKELASIDNFYYTLADRILYRLDVVDCNKAAPIPPVK